MPDRELNIPIDLQPVVNAVARVLSEPYRTFVQQLHADGRITTAEVEALTASIHARGDRLADLVLEELQRLEPADRGSA